MKHRDGYHKTGVAQDVKEETKDPWEIASFWDMLRLLLDEHPEAIR